MELPLSPAETALIERAATMTGESTAAFVVNAAVVRADVVIAEAAVTVVPARYFDELLEALDSAEPAPRLAKVAARTRGRRHIQAP